MSNYLPKYWWREKSESEIAWEKSEYERHLRNDHIGYARMTNQTHLLEEAQRILGRELTTAEMHKVLFSTGL